MSKSFLKLVKAVCGCDGCYYNKDGVDCPVDEMIRGLPADKWPKQNEWPCDTETESCIYVEDKNE